MEEEFLEGEGLISEVPYGDGLIADLPAQPDIVPNQIPDDFLSEKTQEQVVFEDSKRISDQIRREDATMGEKALGVFATWENTYLATGIDWIKNDLPHIGEDDEVFKQTLTKDFMTDYMLANGIDFKYNQMLRKSKNKEHLFALTNEVKEDMEKEKFANEVLNSYGGLFTERTAASVATGLLGDVDMLVPFVGWAAKATKLGKTIAAASMSTYGGVSYVAYEKDPDVSKGEATVSAIFGGGLDGIAAISMARRGSKQVIAKTLNDSPGDEILDSIVKDTNSQDHASTIKNLIANSSERKLSPEQVRASKLLEAADETTPKGKPTKTAVRAKNELDELGYNQKKKPIDPEVEEILEAELKASKQKRSEEWKKNRRERLREEVGAKQAEEIKAAQRSLKERIQKRLAKGKKRSLDTIEKMKRRVDDAVKKEDIEWEVRYFRKEAQDIVDDMSGFRKYIEELGRALKLDPTDVNAIKSLDNIKTSITKLFDEGYINQSIRDKVLYSVGKADATGFDSLKFKFVDTGDGMYELVSQAGKKLGGKKKVLIPAAVLLSGTSVFAAEGDGISTTGIFGTMLVLAGLGFAVAAAPTILSKTRSAIASGQLKNKVKSTMKQRDTLVEEARLGFMERYTKLVNDKGDGTTEFADMVYWNALDGSANSMDTIRHTLSMKWTQSALKSLDLNYKAWLQEEGVGKLNRFGNMFQSSIGYRQKFENILHKAIEQGDDFGSPSVRQAMDDVNGIKAQVLQDMKDAGVKGAENIKFDPTYMPRKIREGHIGVVLRSASEESLEEFVVMFSKMMDNDISKARVYVQGMMAYSESHGVINTMAGLKTFMAERGIIGVSAEEMAGFLGISQRLQRDTIEAGEQFGRTKWRIEIDKTKFQDMTIYTKDGEAMPIVLDNVFVNQVSENLSGFFKQVAGHIAIASKRKTVPEMYAMARNAINPTNKKMMEDTIDDLLGMPILDEHSDATKILRDLANYNVASTMGMSTLSLMQEISLILTNMNGSGFKTALSEMKNIVLKHGKSSELVQSLQDGLGVGMHKYSANYGSFNHLGDANLMDGSYRTTATGQKFSRAGEALRDITLYNLGMIPVSDYLSKISAAQNLQKLGEVLNGTKQFAVHRMKAYGLTDSNMNIVRKYVSLTDDGYAKAIDWENIPFNDRLELQSILFNMNQKQVMQTMMGNIGHWTSSTTIGVATSQLLKFPMGAYTNHGLFATKGLLHGDMRAAGESLGWFISGYLVSVTRAELKGQDRDEQYHLTNALFAMSTMGIVNVGRGVSDPAMFSLGDRLSHLQSMIRAR